MELYDNRIRTLENLGHLTNLVYLDLSFNRIRVIEGLDTLVNVKKLYLVSNRIKKVRAPHSFEPYRSKASPRW